MQQVETQEDFGSIVARWKAELKNAKEYYKGYFKRCKEIVRLYRDDRKEDTGITYQDRRINLLWSNIQTLKPAVLAQKPKPVVSRRNNDSDPISLIASQTLERCIAYTIDDDEFDYSLFQARDDYLLFSRGVCWVVMTGEPGNENTLTDYVLWDDYLQSPSRMETEVRWRSRRVYMTRDQLVQRFGEEIGSRVPLSYTDPSADKNVKEEEKSLFKQAEVWEIWCITDKKVYWICEDCDYPLDIQDDPLHLDKFFPCPRPAYGITTNNTTVPVPEYCQYQDQAQAIDDYESRLQSIREALKCRGFYNKEIADLERLFREGKNNDLIPVDWTQLQGGKLADHIMFAPLETLVNAAVELTRAIAEEKQFIYEVTGISDIIRGATNPKETATAQQLKGQFGTLRLEDKRRELNRFAKDIIETIGEIVSEHYTASTIIQMAGIQPVPPPMPQIGPNGQPVQQERPKLVFPKVYQDELQQALQLLRNDMLRRFRIDIETDSTIASDEAADKQNANEFLAAVGGFLQQGLEAAKEAPPLIPAMGEILMFVVRKYRAGRSLEGVIEQAMEQLRAAAQQPKPNPEMEKIKADQVRGQQEMQLKQQEMQNDMMIKQQESQHSMALEQQKAQNQMELEKYKAQTNADTALKVERMRSNSGLAAKKMERMPPNQEFDLDEEGNPMPSELLTAFRDMLARQEQAEAQEAQKIDQTNQLLLEVLRQLSLPKQLVRDQQGNIVGVQTVEQRTVQ